MNPSHAETEANATADRLAAFTAFAVTLTTYLLTAPRTVVLEDDGYFLQAAWFNAVAHPPGYPLYVAMAHLATLVPVGNTAFRVHALTGVIAALACAALLLLARRLGLGRTAALTAAVALGLSEAFWSQAIIAEVYALNVLLVLVAASLCTRMGMRTSPATNPGVALLGFVYGLGLSNHWPLLILSTPMLLALTWPALTDLWRARYAAVAGVAAGLLPYAWMVWRTHAVPEFCFAGPIESWRDFWFYVSREAYAHVDQNAGAGWGDRARFVGFVGTEAARQFTWFGAALGIAGLVRQWRLWPQHVCWALVLGFLGSTLLLILLLGFDYDAFHRHTFRVYPLVSYAVFTLWVAAGIQWMARAPAIAGRMARDPGIALGALLIGVIGITHWTANDRSRDTWAEVYGRTILESLPENAWFYANADTVNGPVGYLHHVEGWRPDILLASGHSLALDGKLYRPHALPFTDLEALVESFIAAAPGPVAYSNDFPHRHGADFYGLYFLVNVDAPAGAQRAVLIPRLEKYFRALDGIPPPWDPWENMHYRMLRLDQCRLEWSILGARAGERAVNPPLSCRGLHGLLLLTEWYLSRAALGASYVRQAEVMLNAARELESQAVRKDDLVRLGVLTDRVRVTLQGEKGVRL